MMDVGDIKMHVGFAMGTVGGVQDSGDFSEKSNEKQLFGLMFYLTCIKISPHCAQGSPHYIAHV